MTFRLSQYFPTTSLPTKPELIFAAFINHPRFETRKHGKFISLSHGCLDVWHFQLAMFTARDESTISYGMPSLQVPLAIQESLSSTNSFFTLQIGFRLLRKPCGGAVLEKVFTMDMDRSCVYMQLQRVAWENSQV